MSLATQPFTQYALSFFDPPGQARRFRVWPALLATSACFGANADARVST